MQNLHHESIACVRLQFMGYKLSYTAVGVGSQVQVDLHAAIKADWCAIAARFTLRHWE